MGFYYYRQIQKKMSYSLFQWDKVFYLGGNQPTPAPATAPF